MRVTRNANFEQTRPSVPDTDILSLMSNRTPLTSRPLDLTYFIYVATHIPISLFLDCQALYPAHLVPQPLVDLNAYYVNTFKDPLISNVHNLPWFKSFVYCEAIFQIPFFFWALGGLYHSKSTRSYNRDVRHKFDLQCFFQISL